MEKRQEVFVLLIVALCLVTLFISNTKTTSMSGNVVLSYSCNGADINRNGIVGQDDLGILSNPNYYNKLNKCNESNSWCYNADINRDRTVNSIDFSMIGNQWGKLCEVGNLMDNGNFEIDEINKGKVPLYWNKNYDLLGVGYNVQYGPFGKIIVINVTTASAEYFPGIKTNPIYVKPNTNYTLSALLYCDGCLIPSDYILSLHVFPDKGAISNFYYTTKSTRIKPNYFNVYTLYEINFTTSNVQNLSAYVILTFLQGKRGKAYADEISLKEILTSQPVSPSSNLCGTSNENTFVTKPTTNLCNTTISLNIYSGEIIGNLTTWIWTCHHPGTEQIQNCSAFKSMTVPCIQQGFFCGPNKTNIDSSCNELASGKTYSMIPYSNVTYHESCGNKTTTGCCTKFCKTNSSDLNLDGFVNSADLTIFNSNKNKTGCNASNFWCSCSDFNMDTNVTSADYNLFMQNYSTSFWNKTITITKSEFNKGYTEKLAMGERIEVSIESETHHIGIYNLTSRRATIEVSSDIQRKILEIGDIENFDINDDNEDDLSVELISIKSGKAEIQVGPPVTDETGRDNTILNDTNQVNDNSQSNNPITATGNGETDNTWTYVIIAIVVLIIIVGGFLIYYFFIRKGNQYT
ncbi:MAG: hypothetical protein Q7R52_00545 [archaeon]|nr:hypothetical protein [archaeon]